MSGLLGTDISKDEPLMEAGLDSIGAVELRNSVATKFGVELPATVTFDHPSVAALADYLAAKVAPQQAMVLHPHTLGAAELSVAGPQASHRHSCLSCHPSALSLHLSISPEAYFGNLLLIMYCSSLCVE